MSKCMSKRVCVFFFFTVRGVYPSDQAVHDYPYTSKVHTLVGVVKTDLIFRVWGQVKYPSATLANASHKYY